MARRAASFQLILIPTRRGAASVELSWSRHEFPERKTQTALLRCLEAICIDNVSCETEKSVFCEILLTMEIDCENLILLVKDSPCLYDQRDKRYKNNVFKDNEWKKVTKCLFGDENSGRIGKMCYCTTE